MPYVNIKITDEGVTNEQRKRLIAGATKLIVDVLKQKPANHVCDYRRNQHRQLGNCRRASDGH